MSEYPTSAAELRQAAMKQALIKTTELIDRAVTKKREDARMRTMSTEERQRAKMAQAMSQAMSGEGADGGEGGGGMGGLGGGSADPDEVLRMINGIGGMKYRDVDQEGQVEEGEVHKIEALFDALDADGSGSLDASDIARAKSGGGEMLLRAPPFVERGAALRLGLDFLGRHGRVGGLVCLSCGIELSGSWTNRFGARESPRDAPSCVVTAQRGRLLGPGDARGECRL